MMDHWAILEWTSSIIALMGSWVIAEKKPMVWGYGLYIFSDIAIGVLAFHLQRWGLLTLYVAFTIISFRGLYTWVLKR